MLVPAGRGARLPRPHLEEDLLAPPITAAAPQPQPVPGQPPVFDFGGSCSGVEGRGSSPSAPAARNDAIPFGDNAVPGSDFTEAGSTGCIGKETEVSFPFSLAVFTYSIDMRNLSRPLERDRAGRPRHRLQVNFLTSLKTRRKNTMLRRRRLTLVVSLLPMVRTGPLTAGY